MTRALRFKVPATGTDSYTAGRNCRGFSSGRLGAMLTTCARIAFVVALFTPAALAQSTCDSDKSCTGNALRFSAGHLDYVDVFNTPAINTIESTHAMTVEFWANINRQQGVAQYIGGIWGPRTDRDDKWALYIDASDSLTFELSGDSTNFGAFDNTVVKAGMVYGSWVHIAALWDGGSQEARLYLDGRLVARGRNSDYPLRSLRPTVSYLQFGSFNGQSNDPARTRTLDGMLDEVRLWNTAIGENELRCRRNAALQGNEPGLILYLRLNESGGDVLCDASRYNGRGNRRGALQLVPSTRSVPPTVFIAPLSFSFPLRCVSDTTFEVTITDTSACGERVMLALSGADAALFSLNTADVILQQNSPVTVRVRTSLRITGAISALLTATPFNTCNLAAVIPIEISRSTQLVPSFSRLVFDTLFGCENARVSDTVLRMCNGGAGPLTVSGAAFSNSAFTATPSGGWTFPVTLNAGECRELLLRFAPSDTGSFADTLRISSSDMCPGGGMIPVFARRLGIVRTTIDSINFDQPSLPCRRFLNLAEEFFLRNVIGENFTVEDIEFTNAAFSTPTRLPFVARPNTAYRMYIRFRSNTEGYYYDTARIRISFRGCTIYRSIPVHGRIIDVKLAAQDTLVDFGTVVIGRSSTLPVTLWNNGIDTRDVFMYLTSGRVFSIAGGNRFSLSAAMSRSVNITFRPLNPIPYRDTLCFQDVGCQMITKVVLVGNGADGTLAFQPPYLQSANVINCRCRVDTVTVLNRGGAEITLRSVSITGSPKFTFLAPVPMPNETLGSGMRRIYLVQYCPAGAQDFISETADIVFESDAAEGTLRMLLVGTNIEPKLIIDGMTNYGDVEVGTRITRTLRLTNPSPAPVRVDAIPALSTGFAVVATAPPVGSVLQFRDTMLVSVEFAPPSNSTYGGQITATSTDPCPVSCAGTLAGRGIIVPLFIPWSTIAFSEATRCDSVLRVIGLVNDGSVPIMVDSISISGLDAAAFTWRGRTFSGVPPRATPPRYADSIDVLYHPGLSENLQAQAELRITATTRLGQQMFSVNLVGGRIQQFIPNRSSVLFPATPVRTAAAPITVSYQNPSYLDTLYIDSVDFAPDRGVFNCTALLPVVVGPRQTRTLQFGFTPGAAVQYSARIRLVTRVGCVERDTTMSIAGDGYTPPWLTTICVDSTIIAEVGDVLRLPVELNRSIPQTPLEIDFFVGFHRRALQYLGFEPAYTATPALDTLRSDGVKITLRSNQNVVAGPVGYISFRVAASDSMRFFMRTDSIGFASDSTLFIALFGDGCIRTVTINPRCGVQRMAFSNNRYELRQNYPNPFREQTLIEFETLEDTPVRIEVRDTRGRTVAVLADAQYQHGRYQLQFASTGLASGAYSLVMITPTFTAARIMLVAK